MMSVDGVYSYLIDSTWLFLGSWVALLVTAAVAAFVPVRRNERPSR
jgi:hypothetical protein